MAEEKKSAVVIPSSQVVGEGDQRRVVPKIVKVTSEKDMTPELIFKGPEADKGINSYVTVDGKKLRFDGKTGALLSLGVFAFMLLSFVPQSFAQATGRTKVQIPAIEAPFCTKSLTALAVDCTAGKVYLGDGEITVAATTVSALTANKTDCAGPTYTSCDIVYADNAGALHFTATPATAFGSGNSVLAYVKTGASAVSSIQYPWQDTRSDIDVATTAGALASNPTDCGPNTYATTIAANGNLTCGSVTNASTTAVTTNTASTIVLRDGSGAFAAGTITAALVGNADTATALAANPPDCGANTYATTIAASGALTCSAVNAAAGLSGVTPLANAGTGIANGATQQTAATNGTQVTAGTCQAQTPLAITGVVTTSKAFWSLPNAPVATWQTGITVQLVVSAGAVTPYLCNPTAGNITPAAQVLNIGVIL